MNYQISKGITKFIFDSDEIANMQFEKLNDLNEDTPCYPISSAKRIGNIYITCNDRMIVVAIFNEFPNWREIATQIFGIIIGEEEVVAMYENKKGSNVSIYFENGINADEVITTTRSREPNPFNKSMNRVRKTTK